MADPTLDYKLNYCQADVERLTRYIAKVNPGVPPLDAYTKAVRVLGRCSGEERKKLR